jgi:hypothetical protein
MAEVFKNVRAVLGTSASDVYTVPAGTTAIVIGCQAANVHTASRTFQFWWTDASSSNAVTRLAQDVIIPSKAAYEPIGGKLVLEAGDKLRGLNEGANHVEVSVSVLELS